MSNTTPDPDEVEEIDLTDVAPDPVALAYDGHDRSNAGDDDEVSS